MAIFRYDPYLWVHLAGVAAVPLWLAVTLLGLAVGHPTLPTLEIALLVLIGVAPVLAMQLRQPFCIFSLGLLALKPTALDADQRRMLTLFRQWQVRLVALLVPLPLVWLLLQLYPLAVVVADVTPFSDLGRVGGLGVAAGGVLMANLFLQVPVSVALVMATSERRFQATTPYPAERIRRDFTLVGLPIRAILPVIKAPVSGPVAAAATSVVQPSLPKVSTIVTGQEVGHGPELKAPRPSSDSSSGVNFVEILAPQEALSRPRDTVAGGNQEEVRLVPQEAYCLGLKTEIKAD
ncbi:MAG: low-complexity tail membrane protein [Nodosilinea sp.]